MTKEEEDYLLKSINEALSKNVWHDVTPELLAEAKKRSKEKREKRREI